MQHYAEVIMRMKSRHFDSSRQMHQRLRDVPFLCQQK